MDNLIINLLTWDKVHLKRHNMLFNRFVKDFPNAKLESYIDINSKSKYLLKYIKDMPVNQETKKNLLYMVYKYLSNKNSDAIIYATEYNQLLKEIQEEQIKNIYGDNVTDCQISEYKKNYKKRYDLIYRYNITGSTPRDKTLEKYNIVFNQETNLWE
jgi:hypothetical protein